jgi:hypothetical protein
MLGEVALQQAPARPRHARSTLVLGFLALAGMVFAMLQSLVAPALPVIARELGTGCPGSH